MFLNQHLLFMFLVIKMKKENYFYITINFYPQYEKKIFQKIDENNYKHLKTGDIYRKRLMYDWGWGQEYGFEKLPQLSFVELLEMITEYKGKIFNYSKDYMNFIGAISIIMQDHIEELIDFLAKKINTDYFSDKKTKENFKWFSFSSQKTREMGKIPGGILSQSYEEVLNQYPKWQEISNTVKEKIYSN